MELAALKALPMIVAYTGKERNELSPTLGSNPEIKHHVSATLGSGGFPVSLAILDTGAR
jgi:hypothetical protein